MFNLMSCAYKISTQQLTINRPVEFETGRGTVITFQVDNFINPYNGKPKGGYIIMTTDTQGGLIDTSTAAGIPVTIQVSEWTTLAFVRVDRVDVVTTIREASIGELEIQLDIPVDPYCRIEVKFPVDMPLTVDLTEVSSNGILMSPKRPPEHIDLSTRSFYIDGCSMYKSRI